MGATFPPRVSVWIKKKGRTVRLLVHSILLYRGVGAVRWKKVLHSKHQKREKKKKNSVGCWTPLSLETECSFQLPY